MLDELSNTLFNQLDIIIILAIMGLIFWVYLYIIEYSDWFRNLTKRQNPQQATMNLVQYFKLRIRYLLDNYQTLTDKNNIIAELDSITRQYLATITNILIHPGETTDDISVRIHRKTPETELILKFLGRLESMKHKPSGIAKTKLFSYIQFIDAVLSRRNYSLEIEDKKKLTELP